MAFILRPDRLYTPAHLYCDLQYGLSFACDNFLMIYSTNSDRMRENNLIIFANLLIFFYQKSEICNHTNNSCTVNIFKIYIK